MGHIRRFLVLCVFAAAMGFGANISLAADAPAPKDAAKGLVLNGDAKCTSCHDEADDPTPTVLKPHASVLAIGKTRHGTRADGLTPSCTSCHGESDKHLKHRG